MDAGTPRKRVSRSLTELLGKVPPGFIYDVIIVGSGYGGSVAAQQLAGTKHRSTDRPLSVCLLERGREFLPGDAADFPGTFGVLPRELRRGHQSTGEVTGHQGLHDVRLGNDVNALVANGLGGGSLINAGVMLEPRVDDFTTGEGAPDPLRSHWARLLGDLQTGRHFRTARRLLGAEVLRDGAWIDNTIGRMQRLPKKTEALQSLTPPGPHRATFPPITVALENGTNAAGTQMKACNHCGDCMTGCNVGAKDSLDTNLLQAAHRGKVDICTGATVTSLSRQRVHRRKEHPGQAAAHHDAPERCWTLRVVHTDAVLQAREPRPFFLRARRVILAAGTLGSPEILLRSRHESLAFSSRLGAGFSCNGDNIAAVRGLGMRVNGAADEDLPLAARQVGPTITAAALLQGRDRPFLLQEFSVPGPLKRLFDETVTTAATLASLPDADCAPHRESDRDPLAVDPEVMDHTLLVGMIGHDDARGSLRLPRPLRPIDGVPQMGALCIDWPDARHGRELEAAHEAVRTLVEGANGKSGRKLVANPTWRLLPPGLDTLVSQPRGPVLTVHPLGGCGIGFARDGNAAPDARDGVVDEFGCVLDASTAPDRDEWQGSLVVLDGSVVPLSLGVNPALTIAALALQAMAHWRTQWQVEQAPDDADEKGAVGPAAMSAFAAQLPDRGAHPPEPRLQLPGEEPPPPRPHPPRRTEVEVIERLWGAVPLAAFDGGAVVELTLGYEATAIGRLIGQDRRPVDVNPELSRLRIYHRKEWDRHKLKAANDAQRKDYVRFEVEVAGNLRFLHRESTGPVGRVSRALWAWVRNRGLRDIFGKGGMLGRLFETPPARAASGRGESPVRSAHRCMSLDLLRLASRAGEVRRFDYRLTTGRIVVHKADFDPIVLAGSAAQEPAILGDKRLTYDRRANPWSQLTRLRLTAFPGLPAGEEPVLTLDARFLANQGLPLLRITHQRHHAEALAELLSFGLYLARVLISTHLWTFRKPDAPDPRDPVRLPGRIEGLPEPEVTDLVVDRWPEGSLQAGQPLSIRLTRYPRPGADPLLMIHGYSVSGNTFTHPSLQPSAAGYFWQKRRDVWVVELRTSTALPSATYPWAMEQPGLIDIPAALMHVHTATGRKVDVFAHCIGCAMFSMALLSDAQDIRSGGIELGVDTWLTREHLGLLQAFNGVHPSGQAHPVVNSVVLSQKGPVLRYTDANILRAFVLQYVRRWLLPNGYQFRPSAAPRVGEQLLDRLLASLPYPDADYDVENPLWRFWLATPWTGTRHRMDALYGRDFNADNMSRETLEAIDDLFGPINLDTVSQTIHFARFDAITNQRGRGEFVTRRRLKDRWRGIPTLALHGADNGLVDVHTQALLQRLLQDAAGVPFLAHTLPNMGHQDVLLGNDRLDVFDKVQAFLDAPPGATEDGDRRKSAQAEPWIGPRIEPPHGPHGMVRVGCMARPDQGHATLCLVPAIRTSGGGFNWLAGPSHPEVCGQSGPSGRWLFARPALGMFEGLQTPPGGTPGWLAVLVYALDETTARWSPFFEKPKAPQDAAPANTVARPATREAPTAPRDRVELPSNEWSYHTLAQTKFKWRDVIGGSVQDFAALPGRQLPPARRLKADEREELRGWLSDQQPPVLQRCFVSEADLARAQRQATAAEPGLLRIIVGSCQYPNGIVDGPVAGSSLRRLAASLDQVDLALLLGDQIYADATAGMVDPVRKDELYDQPHDRALRLPEMREVLRRVPVQMLLDDHEIWDNWEPLPRRLTGRRAAAARRKVERACRNASRAYVRYQRMGARGLLRGEGSPMDFEFRWAGNAFYMLDTRTGRSRGSPSADPGLWSIVKDSQRRSLEAWLLAHRDEVKFVSTPSLLLPRRVQTGFSQRNATRSDAWDGYPGSMRWLLNFLEAQKIRNTVFLSGDEHHAMVSEMWLGPERLKVVSVHSSGLYAPFPFANGRREDLVANETIDAAVHGVRCEVATRFAPPGDGHAVLELLNRDGRPLLRVQFDRENPHGEPPVEVSLG